MTADILARASVRAAFFTGEETQRRRTENLVAFHDDPDTRILFATDAGGVGLNLQRAASCSAVLAGSVARGGGDVAVCGDTQAVFAAATALVPDFAELVKPGT